jgi:hypothetical protein
MTLTDTQLVLLSAASQREDGGTAAARARARRVVPISELVFGALTQNRSSLEPGLPPIPDARPREGACRMGDCLHRPQPAEVGSGE